MLGTVLEPGNNLSQDFQPLKLNIYHDNPGLEVLETQYLLYMPRVEMLGDNRIEDVRWLCSLSESELDLLISLKKMAIRRASFIGHGSLSNKFDLKMLRGLSFVLMQFLNERLGDNPDLADSVSGCVDESNIVKQEISEEFQEMGVEELMAYIRSDRKKRIAKLFGDDDGDDLVTGKKKRVDHGRTPLA
ncbi:hypothetical protein L6452_20349 [Arctium lappa]|uniref:Uncharacterized protein n=1 Tax=Arctium lappa TaxID=4217 RepID=A0ACB9BB54_ARCLA|nr:hypothetical protein L6452_20349 [Arctium lappa]